MRPSRRHFESRSNRSSLLSFLLVSGFAQKSQKHVITCIKYIGSECSFQERGEYKFLFFFFCSKSIYFYNQKLPQLNLLEKNSKKLGSAQGLFRLFLVFLFKRKDLHPPAWVRMFPLVFYTVAYMTRCFKKQPRNQP